MSDSIKNRYEFVMLYDVENGNPNGDPDAGNMPRTDPETNHGIVTDVCIKRKIRNYVETVKEGEAGFDIYVRQNVSLNSQDAKGIEAVKSRPKDEKSLGFRDFMCQTFYDVRTFGAVMTTAAKKGQDLSGTAGQVRGPVQLAFGKSVDPIASKEVTITRVAITTDEKAATASTEMGRKHIIPYAVYRQEGFISANLARKVTGFSEDDLQLLWTAIQNMFEFDRSAARGKMALRKLVIFKHDSELGDAPAQKLFDLVTVERKDKNRPARAFSDYDVSVPTRDEMPPGVTVIEI
jgi:CRISPR-associated protein Csd2